MADDPVRRFRRWFAAAARAGVPLPEACALATADARGVPAARFVLLKHADARGFVFFTDGRSRKGRELAANARAALVFYWHAPAHQVRVDGHVVRVGPAESDAYWATRPRASQLAARASHQSAPLASRAALLARWHALARQYRGRPVPRPRTWVGYRIVPRAIEFWTRGAHRLHDRERYVRRGRRWRRVRLQP
jgi:pyridoxamine 5'-phosphate oxidase